MNKELYDTYYNQVERVDSIIKQFWMNGFLTVSRKFGKYLPEPASIGNYSVEAIGRNNDKYAIGIILREGDLEDKNLIEKIKYLATRQSKFSHKRVTLFIGVNKDISSRVKAIISVLPADIKKAIKLSAFTESAVSKVNSQRNLFN
ncbi:MAG TPA: hypothetical protein VHP30_06575 [Ignavibacteriales bacterium]|nr:hypothetical protein [Ignavibacteriales bacterium]